MPAVLGRRVQRNGPVVLRQLQGKARPRLGRRAEARHAELLNEPSRNGRPPHAAPRHEAAARHLSESRRVSLPLPRSCAAPWKVRSRRWPNAYLGPKDENDPIVLLEADHRRFEDLLKEGEETTDRAVKRRTRLLKTITSELDVYESIEEKILYPALKPHEQARGIVLEGYQEHHVADLIVKELQALATNDEHWAAKFKVLKETSSTTFRKRKARCSAPREQF